MNLFAHAIPQRPIDDLMLLDPRLAPELRTHDHRLEMMAIAGHVNVIARKVLLNIGLDLFRGDHKKLPSIAQLVAAFE